MCGPSSWTEVRLALQPCLCAAARLHQVSVSTEELSAVLRGIHDLTGSGRSMWRGMLVVASFIQHVLFKVRQTDRLKELSLKHCDLHLNVRKVTGRCDSYEQEENETLKPFLFQQLMQESPDLKSVETLRQLIRILNSFHDECVSRDLRSDTYVSSEPTRGHTLIFPFHMKVRHSLCNLPVRAQRAVCPALRARLLSVLPPALHPHETFMPHMQNSPAARLPASS